MTAVLVLTSLLALQTAANQSPGLASRRSVLKPDVLLTTIAPEQLSKQASSDALEHDTEVSRSESITVVVSVGECGRNERGECNASADLVVHRPDGSVHWESKGVSLNQRRATVPLRLTATDPTGLYKIVATVRDLNARRFGTAERSFGVK